MILGLLGSFVIIELTAQGEKPIHVKFSVSLWILSAQATKPREFVDPFRARNDPLSHTNIHEQIHESGASIRTFWG